jgi:hypothetical protein
MATAFHDAVLLLAVKFNFAQIGRLTAERKRYLMHCVTSLYIASYMAWTGPEQPQEQPAPKKR